MNCVGCCEKQPMTQEILILHMEITMSQLQPDVSVYDWAEIRIKQIDEQMAELRDEKRHCLNRLADPKWAHWAEAERIATWAEPFQRTQLSEG